MPSTPKNEKNKQPYPYTVTYFDDDHIIDGARIASETKYTVDDKEYLVRSASYSERDTTKEYAVTDSNGDVYWLIFDSEAELSDHSLDFRTALRQARDRLIESMGAHTFSILILENRLGNPHHGIEKHRAALLRIYNSIRKIDRVPVAERRAAAAKKLGAAMASNDAKRAEFLKLEIAGLDEVLEGK